MSEIIKTVFIVCINKTCNHKWLTSEIQFSHIRNKCIKCGTEWSQKNDLPIVKINITEHNKEYEYLSNLTQYRKSDV